MYSSQEKRLLGSYTSSLRLIPPPSKTSKRCGEACRPADAARGRRAPTAPAPGPCPGLRVGSVGGSNDTGRADVAVALALSEYPHLGPSAYGPGASGQPDHRGAVVGRRGRSRTGPRQTCAGVSPPDREAQLCYINHCVTGLQRAGQPIMSVDANKQALVGPLPMGEGALSLRGSEGVRTHDVPDKPLGKLEPDVALHEYAARRYQPPLWSATFRVH